MLTLAYARGVMDSGAKQLDTHFVFMNADFVLVDGRSASLARKIVEGHRCVVAQSLRATTETVLPRLAAAVDPATHVLAMPARGMVALTLANLHPTAIAKIVNQDLYHSGTSNQMLWQVDENTLLAHHHLLFMLCIRPERPLRAISSCCDYGFIPEMVPSGRIVSLADSDEFFMLELAPAEQERHFIRAGPIGKQAIARSLGEWVTREHIRDARLRFVSHAADLPPGLDRAERDAAGFVAEVQAMLPATPFDHVNHPHWVGGLCSWVWMRGNTTLPVELDPSGLMSVVEPSSGDREVRGPYRKIICHVTRSHARLACRVIEAAMPVLADDGEIAVFLEDLHDGPLPGDFSGELETHICDLLTRHFVGFAITATYAGGKTRHRLRRREARFRRRLRRRSLVAIAMSPFLGLAWLAISLAMRRANLRKAATMSTLPAHCSSALVTLRRKRTPDRVEQSHRDQAAA